MHPRTMNYSRVILGALCMLALIFMAPASRLIFAATPAPSTRPANATPSRWIGVMVQKIPPAYSQLLGLKTDQGLLVNRVIPNSPAAKAGLNGGDLLILINNKPLSDPEELIRVVNTVENGKPAPCELIYIRGGAEHSATIIPENRPANLSIAYPSGFPNGLFISTTMPAGNIYIQGTPGTIAIGPGVILHLQQQNPGQNTPSTGYLTIQGPMQSSGATVPARQASPQEYIALLKFRIAQLQIQIHNQQTELLELENQLKQTEAAQINQTAPTAAPAH
ncbi:MAG TPA: PDZ domain-containing protein [Phycisphaerae bacterium]|nr:PDZ domain-containing protein [Phycisphaerae bacterium]